jgi:hypothetical protein
VRALLGSIIVTCLLPASVALGQGPDSDGDGLSDLQEIHKYLTDPNRYSTAGDGVSDGDWARRREFSYTVRSIIKVMKPVNLDCLNDDYQDARILARDDSHVELEVVHYPLNTMAKAISANPNWRKDNRGPDLKQYLQPGITTNWDESMQRDLNAALTLDGIDPEELNDKELVDRVTRWLFARSKFTNMFCTHYIDFSDGVPVIFPGLEAKFESDKGDPSWTFQQQLERELFGRSMFANRSHGTCTSTAVYLTTVLRALGVPTRMVLALPLVDATDREQVAMVESGLHHHRVRRTVLLGLAGAKGYSNHTFNEVFVGGRWVRLNSSTLGQNTLDSRLFGLLTHVNTFNDLSEARLAATWGKRYALGERDEVFPHGNPYRALEVSDHFGKYAQIENPEAQEHQALTLTRAYWPGSPECPAMIKTSNFAKKMDARAGYVLAHVGEWFPDESYTQYRVFLNDAAKEFLFQAEGHTDVRGRFWGSVTNPPDVHEIAIVIAPQEYARMAPGVEYVLVPQNRPGGKMWKTEGRITIRREP